MSWAEVFKINSDFSTPLNEKLSQMSIVKSVQRGVTKHTSTSNFYVAINTVNPAKTFVIIQNQFGYKATTGCATKSAIALEVTPDHIYFAPHIGAENKYSSKEAPQDFSWQLIELA